ncbi:unnamed protein product [Brassicogethes aeneus]|uniref:Uncharacterized protein n=1 Tax=Brassicogethes aeneus TaxID=1431903 RepID=A0A9P0FK59_BRAAE|nr:unnamed protein product [Brassicogethes aeneus]
MAADKANHNELTGPTCLHSVNRITKFPAVESSIQTATNLYEKVKDYNGLTQWTLNSAETTVQSIVEKGKPYANPVLSNLEGPIKTVDGILCSGLDYVETKVPAVKLPPAEILLQIYNSTKEYVTPAMETAYAYAEQAKGMVEPRIQQARDLVDPAYQAALHTVEPMVAAVQPTVDAARQMVDPFVQPTLEKAQQLKDYGKQKVNEYLHRGHSNEGDNSECQECQECQDVRNKMSSESSSE